MLSNLIATILASAVDDVRWASRKCPPACGFETSSETALSPVAVGSVELPPEPLVGYRRVDSNDGSEPGYCVDSMIDVAAPGKHTFLLGESRPIACHNESEARNIVFSELRRFVTDGHWRRFDTMT